MSQNDNNTKERKKKHITQRQRYTIEDSLKDGKKPIEIARKLAKHIRTMEKEISRGRIRLLNNRN